MKNFRWLNAIALASAVGLSACGGGSSSSGTAATASANAPVAAESASSASSPVTASAADTAAQPAPEAVTFSDVGGMAQSSGAGTQAVTAVEATTATTATTIPADEHVHALAVAPAASNLSYTFDQSFNVLAPGWSINWWGSSVPNYSASRETRAAYVYGGTASQRYRLNSIASGGGADLIYSYGFVQNTSYSISLNVRSDVATTVVFQFRRNASPYTVVSSQKVTVGPTWQRVTLQGNYPWSDAGSVRVTPQVLGNDIWLDEMAITAVAPTSAQAPGGIALPAQGGTSSSLTTVKYTDMESNFGRFDPGWYFNSLGGTSPPTFNAYRETRPDHVYAGSGSQLFQIVNKFGGDVQLISQYAFVKGKTYHTTLYMKADVATPVQVYMRVDAAPWTPVATKNLTLNTAWQKIDLEAAYTGDASGSVRVALLNPTGTVWVDEMTISEVNKNDMAPVSTATIPDSFFGIHVNKLGVHSNWPGLSTSLVRLWNTGTTWLDIEKTKGVWDFTQGGGLRLDMYVNYVLGNNPNATILYTLGQTPQWASSTPTVQSALGMGAGGAPTNMDDWRDYVRTLARRYVGKIRYWELWNEPDVAVTYNSSMASLVQMASIAREELLAADPNNKLVGPGFSEGQGMNAMNVFLGAGGGAYIDIVAFHWYYSTNPETIAASIDNVRGLMNTYGIGNKPLWNTEGAFICSTASMNCATAVPSLAESRAENARAMFLMATKGLAAFAFNFWESPSPFTQLVLPDYVTPTDASKALGEARTWAKGAKVIDGYRIDSLVYVFRLTRGTDNFVVLWATQPNTLVNLPSAWTVNTARTLTGTESPIPGTRQLTLGIEPILLKQ